MVLFYQFNPQTLDRKLSLSLFLCIYRRSRGPNLGSHSPPSPTDHLSPGAFFTISSKHVCASTGAVIIKAMNAVDVDVWACVMKFLFSLIFSWIIYEMSLRFPPLQIVLLFLCAGISLLFFVPLCRRLSAVLPSTMAGWNRLIWQGWTIKRETFSYHRNFFLFLALRCH